MLGTLPVWMPILSLSLVSGPAWNSRSLLIDIKSSAMFTISDAWRVIWANEMPGVMLKTITHEFLCNSHFMLFTLIIIFASINTPKDCCIVSI